MEKIEGLSIGLDLDSTALNRGLTGVKDKLKSVNSEMKANMSAFDRGDRSIGKYETRLVGLNRKLEVQKEVTKQAKLEYEKMVKEHGEGSKEADKAASSYNKEVATLNNLQRYVGNVREELNKLKEEQRITSSGWTLAGDSLISFGNKLESISGKIKETGKTLTTRLTAPIAGLVGTVATMGFKRAMDLEQVNFMLSTILDSEKKVESVMKGVSDLVTGTAFGLSEIANPVANLLASTASEKDALLHAEVSMELAALKRDDQLVPQLTDLIQKALLSGKVDGTMVNSFANAGIDILAVLGNKLGQSREEMRKALKDGTIDINDALRTMSEGILEGTEGLNGKTVAAGGMIEKSGETLSGKWKNFKASISQVGERMVTKHGIFDGVKNMLDEGRNLFKNSDEIFKPIFAGLGSALEFVVSLSINAVGWFRNLSDGTKNLMGTFMGFLALIGPLLVGLGLFGGVIANVALKLGPLFKSIAKAGGLLKWLKSGFIALTGPVGVTIGILALLGTGFILLYKNSETFRNGVHKLLGKIKELAKNALKAIQPAIQAVITFFKDQLNHLKKFWNENGQIIMAALSNIGKIIKVVFGAIVKVIQLAMPLVLAIIKSVWSNIKGVISGALNIMMGLVKLFSGLFTGNFGKMWEGIKQVFLGALTFIWNFVQLMFWGKMLKGILSLGKLLLNSFKGMWGSIKNVFSSIIKWIVDFVKNRFTSMNSTLNTITTSMKNLISTIWNGIFTFFKTVIQSIWDLVKNRFTNLKNTIKTIFSGIRNLTKTIWNAIKNAIYTPIKNAVTNTLSRFTSLKSRISEIFGSVKKSVKGYVSDMVETIKGMPKRMSDGLKKTGGLIKDGVIVVANHMLSGLGKGVNGVIKGVNWVMDLVGVDEKNQLKPWKVPKYAGGTDGHPGGPAIVGDGGMAELLSFPNGQFALSPATDALVNLPRATSIMSGPDTKLFLDAIPAYKDGKGWLTKIKEGAGAAWDGAKNIGSKAAGSIKTGIGALKDKASQFWDWASGGAKGLMDKVLNTMGVKLPKMDGNFGTIAKGAFGIVKDKVIDFVGGILPSLGGGGFSFPAPFRKTSGYGQRWGKLHKGIDFGAPAGTPIPSQSGGVVRFAGFGKTGSGYGGYGNVVHIDAGGGLSYLYAHNSKNNVKTGDSVRNGQIIGSVGNTGQSKGNHLHFEIRRNNVAVNPEELGVKGMFGASGASGQIKTWITQAINTTGVPKSWLDPLSTIAMKESGGNPKAINNWDSNAKRGTPSKGLMQTIDPTFNAHKLKGMNDIWNPVHNAVAAIRYIKRKYKTVFNTPGIKSMMNGGPYKGYATGGLINMAGMYNLAEDGWPEFVIPTNPARRTAAQKLLALAGREIQGNKRPHQLPNVSSSYGNEENSLMMQLLEATLKQNQLLKKDHAEMMTYLKAIAEKTADVYLGREKVGSLLDQDQAKRINHAGRRMAT
ncbi:peptidoglycan DD-metalloendopeptidase family protein [Peribacillus frigoritolerans]|uniref:peptidoglycan DD-metalloendopeptidase family protein n=1 Tax=Peribacillus frigoritolerans TaxID=450367 RepID=UPI00301A2643